MSATPMQTQESSPREARSAQERAIDEFLVAADQRFGPVPHEVLDDIRSVWPE